MNKMYRIAIGLCLTFVMTACPASKQLKSFKPGKDGWQIDKASTTKKQIHLVRSIHHSVTITMMEKSDTVLLVKVKPAELVFEIPPFVRHVFTRREGSKEIYEMRYFNIGEGYTFKDVYTWYLKQFGFL